MKLIAVTSLFILSAFVVSADQEVGGLVINGEDANIRDHPYMTKVWTLMYPTCGGAILTSRSVLTAAHCVMARISQPLAVSVVVGSSYRRGEGGQRHSALRIFMHPDYETTTLVNDVAVIRTTSRMTFGLLVQSIPLATDFVQTGTDGVFTGWGFIGYGFLPRRATLLQKMYTRTISNEQCKKMYSVTHRADFVVDQKLCILSLNGSRTSVCGGDSGSPLVIDGRVAGVISWRTMPCGDGLPDVFIRISAVHGWIMQNV